MKAKTIVHLMQDKPVRTAESFDQVLARMERLGPGGTLVLQRLTDHGSEKRSFITRPAILRVEEL